MPTGFFLFIDLTTAEALGLTGRRPLLARADGVSTRLTRRHPDTGSALKRWFLGNSPHRNGGLRSRAAEPNLSAAHLLAWGFVGSGRGRNSLGAGWPQASSA
ncbi:MAG: hypothetical protein JOZ35_17775 [Hyphomicrobiales bacterium]|nr:hypothetical protein [Hyphomicrobiales bacterium]